MAGFNSPSILFLSSWAETARDFLGPLLRDLRKAGYERYIEPCSGLLAMSMVAHKIGGYEPRNMGASDVGLLQSVVGYVMMGKPLDELEIGYEGAPMPLTGDVVADAAQIMYLQLRTRIAQKPPSPYWTEMLRSIDLKKEFHLDSFRKQLERMSGALAGISYRPMGIFEHLDAVADDPHMVITANPPSYKGAYERFFDAKGVITWAAPSYEVFNADTDLPALYERYKDAKALLMVNQGAGEIGKSAGPPVWGQHYGRGHYRYVWSNRPDEVRALTDQRVKPLSVKLAEPLKCTIIPYDYQVRPDSTVTIDEIAQPNAAYYKELWLHKLDSSNASNNFGIFIDGYLAGIGGYDPGPIIGLRTPESSYRDCVLLTYCTAAPHRYRLTKLATLLALNRNAVERCLPTRFHPLAQRVITAQLTPYPEAKGYRGIMKIASRKVDKKYGYRLIYVAPIRDETYTQAVQWWIAREKHTWDTTKS